MTSIIIRTTPTPMHIRQLFSQFFRVETRTQIWWYHRLVFTYIQHDTWRHTAGPHNIHALRHYKAITTEIKVFLRHAQTKLYRNKVCAAIWWCYVNQLGNPGVTLLATTATGKWFSILLLSIKIDSYRLLSIIRGMRVVVVSTCDLLAPALTARLLCGYTKSEIRTNGHSQQSSITMTWDGSSATELTWRRSSHTFIEKENLVGFPFSRRREITQISVLYGAYWALPNGK